MYLFVWLVFNSYDFMSVYKYISRTEWFDDHFFYLIITNTTQLLTKPIELKPVCVHLICCKKKKKMAFSLVPPWIFVSMENGINMIFSYIQWSQSLGHDSWWEFSLKIGQNWFLFGPHIQLEKCIAKYIFLNDRLHKILHNLNDLFNKLVLRM